MKADENRAFALLEKLAFERVSGTDGERRAACLLREEAASFGAACEFEQFEVEDACVSHAALEVLEPDRKSYQVSGYKRSLSTGPEGVTADFAYVENALEANLADAGGKIVLINGRPVHDVYGRLIRSGVKGIVTWTGDATEDPEKSDLGVCKLRPVLTDKFGAATAVNMRARDAMELVKSGAKKVRLTVRSENVTLKSQNVISTVRGTDRPEEEIVLGAHYDSVLFSPGACDNAAGCAVLMELLRYFSAHPPRRTLRFVWFGSEEQGLLGSQYYVSAHELDRTVFMINADVGALILGWNKAYLTGDAASAAWVDAVLKEEGCAFDVRQEIQSSDSIHFTDHGVPCLNINRAAAPGAGVIHSRHDGLDFLSAEGLGKILHPALMLTERLANARVFPIRRCVPPEIRDKVDKYLFRR